MFLGFFAWNVGLAMGGIARVSQVQLLQAFVTIAISAIILGERISGETLLFALGVMVVVMIGRWARVSSTKPRQEKSRSKPAFFIAMAGLLSRAAGSARAWLAAGAAGVRRAAGRVRAGGAV